MGTFREDHSDAEPLYEDESERLRHLNAIQVLATHFGASPKEIEQVYEKILGGYKKDAKVIDFLPILVSRRVKHLITNGKREQISSQ
ncbi:MAG TPA: DUF3562 domain-containing protein [Thermodesulfovibrionales bacterium]|nr:DUF3562 domain-containing protein [Thermodesulfovibrionales bacterium]